MSPSVNAMESVVSNDFSLLVRALEINLEKSQGLRPWVVFPDSVAKAYLYDALARADRPYAFEPFYLDELVALLGEGKRRMSPEAKRWRLEALLESEGAFDFLSPGLKREQIIAQSKHLANLFGQLEQYLPHPPVLEEREKRLFDALFKGEFAPLYALHARLPKGVSLHAFGFSVLPASWKEILAQLSATLYLLAPSSHYLGGDGLVGKWSSLSRHTLEGLERVSPLMVMPQSLVDEPAYACGLLPQMGLIRGQEKNRLAYLKADLVVGREEAIALPVDESVVAYAAEDEPGQAARLARDRLEAGIAARDVAIYVMGDLPLSAVAAQLRQNGLPFTLLGENLPVDDPPLSALVAALRLPLGRCLSRDLKNVVAPLFAKGELLNWIKRVRGGRANFFSEVKKWAQEVIESGFIMRFEELGEELAALLSFVEGAYALASLPKQIPALWIDHFEKLFCKSLPDFPTPWITPIDFDEPISYASAVNYLEESLLQSKGAPNLNQDAIRLCPLDHRFILPSQSSIVVGMSHALSNEHLPGLPSEENRASHALLHLIAQTKEHLAFIGGDVPGPLLDDLLDQFPVPLERVVGDDPGKTSSQKVFFTTWQKPSLPKVAPMPCKLFEARQACVDPIRWFIKEPFEPIELDRLLPSPFERAMSARKIALEGAGELDMAGPFAKAAANLIECDAAIKSEKMARFGERRRFIFAKGISRPIRRGTDCFFPATWLEGSIANVTDLGLIAFGKDAAKARARHWPDLALLASVGLEPRLFFIDLDKSVSYKGPFSLEAIARFTALAKIVPTPLMPEAVEPLLRGDEEAFAKVIECAGAKELLQVWQPIAQEVYGAL